jgi:hypothetical protein
VTGSDCDGKGFTLMVDPVPDYNDPQAGVRFIPVPCSRCNQTGSVTDAEAEAVPNRPIPRGCFGVLVLAVVVSFLVSNI